MVFIAGILIVYGAVNCYGQKICLKDKLYGRWMSVGTAAGYQNVIGNVDSLKKVITYTGPHIYHFGIEGVYTFSPPTIESKTPSLRKDTYTINEKTCQIILGTKKNAYKKSNHGILYLDDDYMILTDDNNPHGDYTTLYERK